MIVFDVEMERFIAVPIDVIVAVVMFDELVTVTGTTWVRAFATAACNGAPR